MDSVLAETLPLELVAIDDGSSDGSGAWLDQCSASDPRLRVFHTPPLGIVAALNRALHDANARLVARMDADDRSLPGRLAALVALFDARPGLALAGTGVALHPDGLQGGGMRRYVEWLCAIGEADIPREIWAESPLAHPTIAARRDVMLAAGGYREGSFPEDYDLLLRLLARGESLGKLDRVWYLWRDHPPRLTRADPRYSLSAHRALKAAALRSGPLARVNRVVVWGTGKSGRPFARALVAQGFEVAAWIDVDPRLIGRTLHGAPVVGTGALDSLRGTPIVVAVAAEGARPLIRAELARRGFVELSDFWVVA